MSITKKNWKCSPHFDYKKRINILPNIYLPIVILIYF